MKYLGHNQDAANLQAALARLISDAQAESVVEPLELNAVPGGWFFTEGTLGAYSDLESAYSKFKIEVTGGESAVLRQLRHQIKGSE